MKYCKNCGAELADDANVCTRCGKPVGEQPVGEQAPATVTVQQSQPIVEKKHNGCGIAGFVLALVSLVFSWSQIFAFILVSVGFILSLVGIIVGKKKGQKIGLAIAGLIISLFDLILAIIFFIVIGSLIASLFSGISALALAI